VRNSHKKRLIWITALIICQTIIILYQYFFSQSINSRLQLEIQDQTKESARRIVQLAYNSIEHIVMEVRSGELEKDVAREQISDIVRKLVYTDDTGQNYVFMSSYDGTMLVQPFDKALEGTNQLELKDAEDNYIIRNLIAAAKKQPSGSYVEYSFYPPNLTVPEKKLSFVMGIPEIDAYIGTGMYAMYSYSDLKQILNDQKHGYTLINLIVLFSLLLFIMTLYRSNKLLSAEILKREQIENNIMMVFDTIYDGVMVHDNSGRILQANRSCCDIFQVTEEEILNMTILDLSDNSEAAQPGLKENREKAITEGYLYFEWKGRRPHTDELFDEEIISKKYSWSGHEAYVLAIRDITEKKKAEAKLREQYLELETTKDELQQNHDELSALYEELAAAEEELRRQYEELTISQQQSHELMERYMLAADGSSSVIWDWDSRTRKLFISDRIYELLGYSKDEIKIETSEDYWRHAHPDDIKNAAELFSTVRKSEQKSYSSIYRMVRKDGSICWLNSRSKIIYGEDGEILRRAGSTTDITQEKQYEQEIEKLAYYDYLTGLPNRVSFTEELRSSIDKCAEKGRLVAINFIDMDNFKFINDTFGHSYGDKVLVLITKRLDTLKAGNIKIFRIGGDEFIIVQKNCKDASECIGLTEKLLSVFSSPINIDDNSFYSTCSIGVAIYPNHGSSVEEIFKNADLAMYKAKNSGKNRYVLYEHNIGEELSERIQLERDLREAFENNEFELYYQPQVETVSRRISGFEALLRWNSPKRGQVPPGKFIPVAEEMGLINDIGKWVIEQSFMFAKSLQGKGICISCNVSPLQLIQSDFTDNVISLFSSCKLERGGVALEITENILVESFEDISEKLKKLRENGILVYLDDFGTGYSSLTYLKSLPIDIVKIDKQFIDDIIISGEKKNMVKSIISLAHDIGLRVVAEGVEEEVQREYLVACQCCFIQGYLISKPVPEKLAVTYLSSKAD